MLCPHCSTSFFEQWTRYGAFVWNDDNLGQSIMHTGCPNCGKLVVKIVEGNVDPAEEDFELDDNYEYVIIRETLVYPQNTRVEYSEDVPEGYREDIIEAEQVLPLSPKAAGALTRRLLQRLLSEELGAKDTNLSKQIEAFVSDTSVPSHIAQSVDAIRNIGNFAAHPLKETNTREVVEVEPGEAEWSIEVLKYLFDFVFVQPQAIQRKRAELNSKLRSIGKPEMK